ncbi:hypothetical protein PALB_470 [Pseudoalteromonas luteoviolacea B = ATCC 29581]|nr:hypothetical protein PALB_470 [Pseudoalteromonas luteoviolacea B = ATCC 29581]
MADQSITTRLIELLNLATQQWIYKHFSQTNKTTSDLHAIRQILYSGKDLVEGLK